MIVVAHIQRKVQNLSPDRLKKGNKQSPQTIKSNPEVLLYITLKCSFKQKFWSMQKNQKSVLLQEKNQSIESDSVWV